MLKFSVFEGSCTVLVKRVYLLFELIDKKGIFNSEKIIQECPLIFGKCIFRWMNLIHVGNILLKIVDEIKSKKLF